MEIGFFLKGVIIGVILATPLGPVGTLCVQRTFTEGKLHGLISGLGATVADVIFGSIAAFGLTMVSNFFAVHQVWIRLIGGLFILFLAVRIFLLKPRMNLDMVSNSNLIRAFASAFVITITNPITIITLAVMFAGLGLVSEETQYASATIMIFGVFVGSSLVWLSIWGISVIFRNKFNPSRLYLVNKVAGIIIFAFGVLTLASLL